MLHRGWISTHNRIPLLINAEKHGMSAPCDWTTRVL